MAIPTNRDVARRDHDDEVTALALNDDAVIALVEDCQKRQQPILVGTVSIENLRNYQHS